MFPENTIGEKIILPQTGTWPETAHVFDETSVYALQAALAAGRPLLVRGEPGTGKSQLARAAAFVLNRLFISEVVNSRSEGRDLQYHFDAVARLGDAQAQCSITGGDDVSTLLGYARYLCPGPLWWAFDYSSATVQYESCRHKIRKPEPHQNWQSKNGCVLLIDEIDKAEADLPNSLLETLGNGAFNVPYLDKAVGLRSEVEQPLVIITTNEERELPDAFIRRCLVLQLDLPKEDAAFIDWMITRGKHHFEADSYHEVFQAAAELLLEDRKEARRLGVTPPGQAEYLDMVRAICRLIPKENSEENKSAQLAVLKKISRFSLHKHPRDE